jgi:sigma-B regulation protein RsbU (phosphoserine phosphatase)
MMLTKGLIAAASQDSSDLASILRSTNLHLHRACKRRVFVTMAALALDPASRRVDYGRAGHNPLVWRRARRGETLLVKPPGVGLGMCGGEPFARTLHIDTLELEPGDALVLYSDGITEAINASLDQYGEERLMRAVEAADGRDAAETRSAVLDDLASFTAGTPARDDITLVALRVAPIG